MVATEVLVALISTGGVAVILGPVGANFGAGMTGGMAYLYDPKRSSGPMMNMETLITCKVTVQHWKQELKVMVQRHLDETASIKAANILQHWEQEIENFVQVCPKPASYGQSLQEWQ